MILSNSSLKYTLIQRCAEIETGKQATPATFNSTNLTPLDTPFPSSDTIQNHGDTSEYN